MKVGGKQTSPCSAHGQRLEEEPLGQRLEEDPFDPGARSACCRSRMPSSRRRSGSTLSLLGREGGTRSYSGGEALDPCWPA